jgi:hypothetical protein
MRDTLCDSDKLKQPYFSSATIYNASFTPYTYITHTVHVGLLNLKKKFFFLRSVKKLSPSSFWVV